MVSVTIPATRAAVSIDAPVNTIVFDVDGTLYDQRGLRRAMAVRLIGRHLAHPVRGWQTARVLRLYRRAQERLRDSRLTGDVAAAQISLTCAGAQVPRETVVAAVTRWMEQEPLPLLRRCIQPGLLQFLRTCQERGLRIGALSDYPAEAKLAALGISGFFDVVLCAQTPEVSALKPDPRGLLLAIERLGGRTEHALYVGDRADIDGATAAAAGVRCALLDRRRQRRDGTAWIRVRSYSELHHALWPS